MTQLAKEHRDAGLVVLAVNGWNEDRATVRQFVKEKNLNHTILMDGSDVYQAYHARGLPTLVWIDRLGMVQDAEVGRCGEADLRKRTVALLDRRQ